MRIDPPPPAGTCNLVRVVACSAAPFDPEEVLELSTVDVMVDDSGAGVGEVRSMLFDPLGSRCGDDPVRPCTPAHIAAAVWDGCTPDALVAYDSATASVVFGRATTRRLPWISLHKVARRLWPTAPSYFLEPLSRWRSAAWGERRAHCLLPSGSAREAYLAAELLAGMIADPILPKAGQPIQRADLGRHRRAGAVLVDLCRNDALQAALRISALPTEPLRQPPGPWDDEGDWAGVGMEDLKFFASAGTTWVQSAARAEMVRRAREAALEGPRWQGLLLRRVRPPGCPPPADPGSTW